MRLLLLAVSFLAGCAGAVPAPPGPRPVPSDADTARAVPALPAPDSGSRWGDAPVMACVPPGMPPFSEWRQLPGRSFGWVLKDSTAERVPGMLWYYAVDGARVQVMLIRSVGGVVVDPAMDDPEVPVWYDAGVVRPVDTGPQAFALLATPGPRCQWRKMGQMRT